MLIAKAPLRISLFGGGSDLPSFLVNNQGKVLSLAIDRCVYVVGHPFTHRKGILLKYAKTEDVVSPDSLQHPIARVVFNRYRITDFDIAVMSDVPAGTGLGSSSAFTVALLAFARTATQQTISPYELAKEACEIEIDLLGEPIGRQDQWASAVGGINKMTFIHEEVQVESLCVSTQSIEALEKNIRLVPIGGSRSASQLLQIQGGKLTSGGSSELLTRRLVELVDQGVNALRHQTDDLGPLLHESWMIKRQISAGITNDLVDFTYDQGLRAGATGGKLFGAGGSGYLGFYVPEQAHERFGSVFPQKLDFKLSTEGSKIVHKT